MGRVFKSNKEKIKVTEKGKKGKREGKKGNVKGKKGNVKGKKGNVKGKKEKEKGKREGKRKKGKKIILIFEYSLVFGTYTILHIFSHEY